MTIERGERWAGRIRPGHPAFDLIRLAIQSFQPGIDTAESPSTQDIGRATGIPSGTLGRYMRHLTEAGHVVPTKNGNGRGYTWTWVDAVALRPVQTVATAPTGSGVTDTPTDPRLTVRDDLGTPVLRIQNAAANGGRRPFPFTVYPMGSIGGQEVWQGRPLNVIGFTNDLVNTRITVWWGDYVTAGDWASAVGRYVVTETMDGDWAAQVTPVESVTDVTAEVARAAA